MTDIIFFYFLIYSLISELNSVDFVTVAYY
jgi:hypothetical protein